MNIMGRRKCQDIISYVSEIMSLKHGCEHLVGL